MTRVSEQPSRWSKATVYPDMWVDPDDDPRNSDGVSPDGELATLQDYLLNYRLTLRMKCEGLDPEQLARRSVPPSTMSLLGLVRHLAEAERDWSNWITSGDPLPKLYGDGDADFDGAVAEQAAVDAAYADLAHEQAATDAMLAEHPPPPRRTRIFAAAQALWRMALGFGALCAGLPELLRQARQQRAPEQQVRRPWRAPQRAWRQRRRRH